LIFEPLGLPGLALVRLEPRRDERGVFARAYCAEEFERAGLPLAVAQCNLSRNRSRGTLRGLHWQEPPFAETRLVRCVRGRLYDVAVDLRRDSPTFRRWVALELTAEGGEALYVPAGFAHGFQTLEDDCEAFYLMSAPYDAASARGARWNDPAFAVQWPIPEPVLSERDRSHPDFAP
jgi:dTDP-4-dehydrorhamnose 3,5-epimerase